MDISLCRQCEKNHSHIEGSCLVCLKVEGITSDYLGNWGKSYNKGSFHGTYKGHYMAVHRIVMSVVLNRKLGPREIVHHKNKNKLDNRIENLELMSWEEHIKHHAVESTRPEPAHIKCLVCNILKSASSFRIKHYTIVTKTPKRRLVCNDCHSLRVSIHK